MAASINDPALDWARDHRVHHKYSETDADPYNSKRGFFFSHMGWLFVNKHTEVIAKGKGIDHSDLFQDRFLIFKKKYYFYVMPIICFLIPILLPMYLWEESFSNAYAINILRYLITLHSTMAINSVAHRWGSKPYEKSISPAENYYTTLLTLGEGWHNFHHAFPRDYKTAELGNHHTNLTTLFIDLMEKIGWAYDLKTTSQEMIKKRVLRAGDGSHAVWGWGDKDEIEDNQHQKKNSS